MPETRLRLSTLLGGLLLAALVLFSSVPKASTIVFQWPWAFYAQLLLLVPAFLLAAAVRRGVAGDRALWWTAAFVGGALGVSIVLSRQPHFSFEAALPLWGGLAWLLWLCPMLGSASADGSRFLRHARLAGVAMGMPLVVSLAGYTGELTDVIHEAGWRFSLTEHRNWYPLGHWNYTGALALLTVPWFLVLARHECGRWRLAWLAFAGAGAAVFVTASSRGAVLGVLVGGAAAAALWVSSHRPSRRQLLIFGLGTLLVAAGLLASNPRLRQLVLHPAGAVVPNEGDVQRLGMNQAGWLLARARPWVGHGPGMVSFLYPEVRAQVVGGVETSYQLHNAPLHWLVTTGGLGCTALAILLGLLARTAWRWRRQPAGLHRNAALTSAVTLAAYAGLALTDYQLDVIALVALLGFHGAVVLSGPLSPPATTGRARLLSGVVALAGAATVVALVPHWWARYQYWQALVETPKGQPATLARNVFSAVAAAPWCTHYRNEIGLQLALAAEEPAADPTLRASARGILASSLAIDPAQEPVHAALGWLWLPESPARAQTHFVAALRLLPDRGYTHFGLALAQLGQDRRAAAVQALGWELLVNPSFIGSPYWRQAPFSSLRGEAVAQCAGLLDRVLADPQLPSWRRPLVVYQAALLRWWSGGSAPTAAELGGANESQRTFFAIAARPLHEIPRSARPWSELAAMLAEVGSAPALASAEGSEALRQSIHQRAETIHPLALAAMLRQSPPAGTDVVARTQLYRGHYPLMHRNIDGPGYADLAPYLEDVFFNRYGAPLFPPRSIIPGPVLEALPAENR